MALSFRDFRLFWGGSFISQMGNQMQVVAVAWQLYILTHSAVSLGLIGLSNIIPVLAFSLLGGVTADKVNRKNLIIVCQLLLATLTIILFLQTHFHLIEPWMIYLILGLSASVNAFNMPARQSVMPNLVPKKIFINAVSLNTLQRQAAILIGPALAGFMIALSSVELIYLFNSISFVIFLLTVLPISVPVHNVTKQISFNSAAILEGVKFVKSSSIILSTMVLDFLATLLGTATILMPVFAKDILGVGAAGLGFLYAAPAVGGVLAGIYFSGKHQIGRQGKIILGSILLYGVSIIGFGLSRSYTLSLVFLVLMGMGDMISTILRNTIRQSLTPDHLRGRMTSIMMLFVQGGPQLGDAEAGFLASFLGAPATTVIGGVGTVVITLLIAKKSSSLRNYQGHEVTI